MASAVHAATHAAARAVAVTALVLCAACSGIPRSGTVTTVRPVEAAGDRADLDRGPRTSPVFVRFPPPPPQASPEQIVRGFLDAHADLEPNLRVARQYLAEGAAWDARAGVTVFSGDKTVSEPTGTRLEQVATVTVTRTATVTRGGEYVPLRDPQPTVLRLRMRLEDGEYRLVDVPPGLVLSESGLERAFRRSVLYFPDAARRRLVPDPVFVPRGATSDVTTVASRLVAGPTAWLAPVVRTAIPIGTSITGSVAVLRGVATVNLSREVDEVTSDVRAALVAQVVWTLTEPGLGVDGVRVLAGGRPLVLSGGSTRAVQRRSDWSRYDPDPTSDAARLYFLHEGRVRSLDRGEATTVRDEPDRLSDITVTRSGALLGAVRENADGTRSLLVGALSGRLTTRLTTAELRSPSWQADDERVWVVQGGPAARSVVVVPLSGAPARVAVDRLGSAVVDDVVISPEGTRALVVLRRGRAREVMTARVESRPTGLALTGLRPLRPVSTSVRAATWESASRVVLADGGRIFRLDADGFDAVEVPVDGLPAGSVTTVAGGASADLVVGVAGRLWRRAAGWREAAVGTSPAYAG